jgi:uncharacterized membrane protein YkgB
MVVVFVSFGMQKFTLESARGIVQYISNSPFIFWLSVFGLRGEAHVLGVADFAIAALLVAGAFSPILSAVGSLMGVVTFAITWSFFFTTPGVVKWSFSTDPIAPTPNPAKVALMLEETGLAYQVDDADRDCRRLSAGEPISRPVLSPR